MSGESNKYSNFPQDLRWTYASIHLSTHLSIKIIFNLCGTILFDKKKLRLADTNSLKNS